MSDDPGYTILVGDVLDVLGRLEAGSCQTCVTSPPYWGLRDYGTPGQLGLEATREEFLEKMVEVFRGVKRVLRDDGTAWVNMGDSFGDKQLAGIPWRLALALQQDGWYLRSDIIWAKPNPMPESVTDRPTKSHEYVFLLSKGPRYFYDAEALKLPAQTAGQVDTYQPKHLGADDEVNDYRTRPVPAGTPRAATRNARTVWTIPTQAYPEAHFATFPEELPRRCIAAGSREGDTVLDPFLGSGTTLAVAARMGRRGVGVELNPAYAALAENRIQGAVRPNTARTDEVVEGLFTNV